MIHAFEPDPVTNRQEARCFFDVVSQHPEPMHMVTHLKSPDGRGEETLHLQAAEGSCDLVIPWSFDHRMP